MKNIAVIVTFNKKTMLVECLNALLSQTVKLDGIVVFDNGSNDDTKTYLQSIEDSRVHPIFSTVNLGGAGGFNRAIKAAMEYDPTAVWIMDDDSIVKPNALEELVSAKEQLKDKYGFLSSNVLWTDGNPCLMNIPEVDKVWNSQMTNGLVKLKHASFVSMYVNAQAIKKVGYPISEFFIWGDDIEYSERISQHYASYFVPKSTVIHKMKDNVEVNILTDDPNRISRYYYDVRNKFYRFRKKGMKYLVKYILRIILLNFKVIFVNNQHKLRKLGIITEGFFAGVIFNPKIDKFSNKNN
ncbi:glycosyltransferase family 2 protein [Loigolactobacillus coryniformis]|uniref:glycosyltransferase family 2 protein n=1 Tax=Loigolactobacillus coryniformis TaxID=1610 RepID=UPI000219169B|nr:glycosyltransferase family 2 protein [Loigolactobacillus coryniformis]ATO55122.1 glycosyl transferase [Loigolactobacillus coryniformis subsp. coryniformis KCTC 3167 = DSM 20001]